jgi:hypothetical protein
MMTESTELIKPGQADVAVPENVDSFKKTRAEIRKTLMKTDKGLVVIWDELNDLADSNEMIRMNMNQMQVHFQNAQQEFWGRKAKNDKELSDLLENPDKYDEYKAKMEQYAADDEKARKHITDLARITANLAKEYRQCAMQKKYVVHLVKVRQLILVVQAAIHQHVHDQNTLNAISRDIQEAVIAMFPIGSGTDY